MLSQCGCGAITFSLEGEPVVSFETGGVQSIASAKFADSKGGYNHVSALTEYGTVHCLLYKANQVKATGGTENIVCAKSFDGGSHVYKGMNPSRFRCAICNTHILQAAWPGGLFMGAKCIEGAPTPEYFVELGDMMDPGIIDKIKDGRGAGKTVDKGMPADLEQKIMSTHPQQAPHIQMQGPKFIPPTFHPRGIPAGVDFIFDRIPKPGAHPHQFDIEDVVNPKQNCVVCLFGVIPRSITTTWPSIEANIVDPLKLRFNVFIYVFNLNVGSTLVDGVVLDQSNVNTIPYDFYEEEMQDAVDTIIDFKCRKGCQFKYGSATTSRNAMRQLYSEKKIGSFLSGGEFDFALVCGPDYFIARPLNMEHVDTSLNGWLVYTSQVNDAEGYTNGFYFGNPRLVGTIMRRYDEFESSNHDYEYGVKKAFDRHCIHRMATDIIFWKVRANGAKHWRGQTHFVSHQEAERVHKLFAAT